MQHRSLAMALALLFLASAAPSRVEARGPVLTEAQKASLDRNWQLVLQKQKGPYTRNYCVCKNGERKPVQLPDGRIVSPCGGAARFCAAWREPWAEALTQEGLYVGNLFARDLHDWDKIDEHHDLVRGFILEKFLVDTHPEHKLAQMRAYGGLAGAEYEARAAPLFFERYLELEAFNEPRHYLLAYELQRRFFVRDDQGAIGKARNLASAIHRAHPDFKPLRDAVHNQISAAHLPRLRAYRDGLADDDSARTQCDELIAEITKLTSLDTGALKAQLAELEDAATRSELEKWVPAANADAVASTRALGHFMSDARRRVEARQGSVADRRRLIDLAITAAAVIQQRGASIFATPGSLTARQHVELLSGLVDAAYGGGLLMQRERAAAARDLEALLAASSLTRATLKQHLARAARVVEWAQQTALFALEEVRLPWTHVLPAVGHISDDILRGSPLMLYATTLERLEDFAAGGNPVRHELFGQTVERNVRALNPGLAFGTLRVAPSSGDYSRNEVLALPETPADLDPAAGILTRGEGNVVSHVQLLARALGIPNAVIGNESYEQFVPFDGQRVFYISTPGGRVVVKAESGLSASDRSILAEYTRNQERGDEGKLGGAGNKLKIDVDRLDLDSAEILDLSDLRRRDSGARVGPKAAFLGELKHFFPDQVARGLVVPFGTYYAHYRATRVQVPAELAGAGIAANDTPLPEFVEATYAKFFDEMLTSGMGERELSAWIQPRLAVMRHSIQSQPLTAKVRASIRDELTRLGLVTDASTGATTGLFIRSDTNVEDLDNFNGAGLNLTLFNQNSLDEIYAGLKEVWASPFTYRSFSWRQTLIDQPLWVLPSVVLLETVPVNRSGVLVTADIDGVGQSRMLIATSEGVGGAVDGTPAETIVWSKHFTELVTMFKSPYRRMIRASGGTEIRPATGSETVLSNADILALVTAGMKIRDQFEPSRDSSGRARPWDVEFGFTDDRLWLFQTRPFIGNESLANVPALAAYEVPQAGGGDRISLDAAIQ